MNPSPDSSSTLEPLRGTSSPSSSTPPPSPSPLSPSPSPPRRGCLGRLFQGLFFLLLLFLLLIGAISFLPTGWLRDRIVTEVKEKTGRSCSLDRLGFSLLRGGIWIENFRLEEKDLRASPFFSIGRLTIQLDLMALLQKRLLIRNLLLEEAHLSVVRDPEGRFNFEDLLACGTGEGSFSPSHRDVAPTSSTPKNPSRNEGVAWAIEKATFRQNRIHYQEPSQGIETTIILEDFTLTGRDRNKNLLLDGTIALGAKGEVGHLRLHAEADLFEHFAFALQKVAATVELQSLDLAAALSVVNRGNQAGIRRGMLSGTLNLTGTSERVEAQGELAATSFALDLPGTPSQLPDLRLTVSAESDLAFRSFRIQNLSFASTLTSFELKGEIARSEPAAAVRFPLQGQVEAAMRLHLEPTCRYLREQGILAGVEGSGAIRIAGPITISPSKLLVALTVEDEQLLIRSASLREALPLSARGTIRYESDIDQIEIGTFLLKAGNALSATLQGLAQGLEGGKPKIGLTLDSETDLSLLLTVFARPAGPELVGKGVLHAEITYDPSAQQIYLGRVRLHSDGTPLSVLFPDSAKRLDLGAVELLIPSISYQLAHDRIQMDPKHAIQWTSDPLRLRLAGQIQPAAKSADLGIDFVLDPKPLQKECAAAFPSLTTSLRPLVGRGVFRMNPSALHVEHATLQTSVPHEEKTIPVSLDIQQAMLPFEATQEGQLGALKIRLGEAPADSLSLISKASFQRSPLAGKMEIASCEGQLRTLAQILRAYGVLPPTYDLSSQVRMSGNITRTESGDLLSGFSLFLENLVVEERKPGVESPLLLFQDPKVTIEIGGSLQEASKRFRLDTLRLATAENAIELEGMAQGILPSGDAKASGGIDEGTRLAFRSDLSRLPQLFPTLLPKEVQISGAAELDLRLSGAASKIRIQAQGGGKKIHLAGGPFGEAGQSLGDPVFRLQSDLCLSGVEPATDQWTLHLAEVMSDFIRFTATGRCHRIESREGVLSFGNGAVLDLLLLRDHEMANRPIPGLSEKIRIGKIEMQGRLAAPLLDFSPPPPGQPADPARPWRLVTIRDSRYRIESIDFEGRPIQEITGELAMEEGRFHLLQGKAQYGGPIVYQGMIDLNAPAVPAQFTLHTAGLDLATVVGTVGDYAMVESGTFRFPDPAREPATEAVLGSLVAKEPLQTLRVERGSLLLEKCSLLIHKDLDWMRWLENDFSVALAQKVLGRSLGAALDRQKHEIAKQIRYERIGGPYRLEGGILELQGIEIVGGNTADFEVQGTIGLHRKLDLRIFLIRNVHRTLPAEDLSKLLLVAGALGKLPMSEAEMENLRRRLEKDLPARLEELGKERKLYVTVAGTIDDPQLQPKPLRRVLLQEGGRIAAGMVKDLLLQGDKLKNLVPEEKGGKVLRQLLDGLGGETTPAAEESRARTESPSPPPPEKEKQEVRSEEGKGIPNILDILP